MSTTLYEGDDFTVNIFAGGRARGRCIQVTVGMDFVQLPTASAARLGAVLLEERLSDEELIGAIARGWCREGNQHKVMDAELALAIAEEVRALLRGEEDDGSS